MPRGGSRVKAGRKKGVPNKKTQAAIEKAEAEGIMPKDVLLNVMRRCYDEGDYIKAAEIAKDAAPYFTPRLAAVAHSAKIGVQLQIIEEILDSNPDQDDSAASDSAAVPPK